jgi:hypothetical protein
MTNIAFVGATATGEYNVASGSSGGGIDVDSTGTRDDVPPISRSVPAVEPGGLAEWVNSPEAAPYQGRWVLLGEAFEVLDVDDSPGALLGRHGDVASPTIVFVSPRSARLAV